MSGGTVCYVYCWALWGRKEVLSIVRSKGYFSVVSSVNGLGHCSLYVSSDAVETVAVYW